MELIYSGNALANLATAVLSSLAAAGAGKLVIKPLLPREASVSERILLYFTAGTGILGLLILASGLAGLISRPVYILSFLLLSLYACPETLSFIKPLPKRIAGTLRGGGLEKYLLIVLLVSFFFNFAGALMPAVESDALQYHLTEARYYIERGRVYDVSHFILNSVFPQNIEMLFTACLAIAGTASCQMLHCITGLFIPLCVYLLLRRHTAERYSLLGAALSYVTPLIAELSSTAMIDITTALYASVFIYLVNRAADEKSSGLFIAAGIVFGSALGSKYTMGLMLLYPLAYLFFSVVYKRIPAVMSLKGVILICTGAGLMFLPHLAKNYAFTGNPVNYFLMDAFGGVNVNDYVAGEIKGHYSSIKIQDLRDGFKWTADLIGYLGPVNFIMLLFAGSLRKNPGLYAFYCSTVLLFFSGLFVFTKSYRYFIIFIPALAALTALIYSGLEAGESRWRKNAAAGFILLSLTVYCYMAVQNGWQGGAFLFNKSGKTAYMERKLSFYGSIPFVNGNIPASETVISMNETRTFYFIPRFMLSYHSVPASLLHTEKDPARLAAALKAAGFRYLYLNNDSYFTGHTRPCSLFENGSVDLYFDRIYSEGTVSIFRLKTDA